MNYSDKDLLRASQIAYYDINESVIDDIRTWVERENITSPDNAISPTFSLSELFEHSLTFKNSIYTSVRKSIGLSDNIDVSTREQALSFVDLFFGGDEGKRVAISEVYDIIEEIEHGDLGNWKLVSYVFNDDIGKKGVAGKLVDGKWTTDNEFSPSGDGLCAYVFETSDDITALCYYNLAFAS